MATKKSAEQLIEEARRRMERIYEYTYFTNGTFEDGEQAAPDPNAAAAPAPGSNAMGGDPNATPAPDPNVMGADPMAGGMPGGDPNAMGGDPNAAAGADPNAMGADPNAGMNLAPNAGDAAPAPDPNAMGGDPNMMGGPMAGGMPGDPMAGGAPNPQDNVIEISQLTDTQQQMQQAQDEQSEKLDGVDKKISSLMNIVDKFTQALTANDEKISELKRELQRRTPTEEETMNVRLNAGGNPFDVKPEEFWDKFKDINNHYNITANNDAPQYQIKKGDIDNVNDRLVSDEFDDDEDFERIPSTLKEYFIR